MSLPRRLQQRKPISTCVAMQEAGDGFVCVAIVQQEWAYIKNTEASGDYVSRSNIAMQGWEEKKPQGSV